MNEHSKMTQCNQGQPSVAALSSVNRPGSARGVVATLVLLWSLQWSLGANLALTGTASQSSTGYGAVAYDYSIGKYDVTSEEFLLFLKETGYQPEPCNALLNMQWRSLGNGYAYPPYDEEPRRWPASC